jgi:peroxiredoxin
MKKLILIVGLTGLLAGISFLGYKGIRRQQEIMKTEAALKQLPEFEFSSLQGTLFTRDSLNASRPVLILYFHPECEHCQYESAQLVKNRQSLAGTELVMVSTAPEKQIRQFADSLQLHQLANLHLLHDKEHRFETYFGNATFPTTLAYSGDWLLQKKYLGEIKMESILECLRK